MKIKAVSGIMLTLLLTSMLTGTFIIRRVKANPTPILFVSPAIIDYAEPGDLFVVAVYIMDVLYEDYLVSYDVKLGFDPAILYTEKDWVQDGGFLADTSGGSTSFYPSVGFDHVRVTDLIMDPGYYAEGEGSLFSVTFDVTDSGRVELDLYDTKLIDKDLLLIEHPPPDDGLFYTDTPRARFDYSYTDMDVRLPIVDQDITFNATYDPSTRTGSYDPDNPVEALSNYRWDFGDGTIVETWTSPIITHSYANTGEYTPTLTVTDNEGKTDSFDKELKVAFYDLAVTDILVYPAEAQAGAIVTINVTVHNYGTEFLDFNLTLYYDNTLIWYNQTEDLSAYSSPLIWSNITKSYGVPLDPNENQTITFHWNTTGIPEATYTIKANASLLVSGKPDLFLENVENKVNNYAEGSITIGIPVISATIYIDPNTLNLKSQGNWITAYLQLPEVYNPEDIDATTILLNETISPILDPKYDFVTDSSEYIVDHDGDGILERMVKFNRTEVASWICIDLGIEYGNVTLTITGELFDGTPFEGKDTIKVWLGGGGGGGGGWGRRR